MKTPDINFCRVFNKKYNPVQTGLFEFVQENGMESVGHILLLADIHRDYSILLDTPPVPIELDMAAN